MKITSGVTIVTLSVWTIAPSVVSAGLFNFASAERIDTPRAETLQNLPIMEAHMSPMLLATIDATAPITDDDTLTAPFLLYDLETIDVPDRETISTYTVESGDTLSGIASQFGVSTNTIRWANDIPAKATVKVGQKLVILPITGVRHKVTKGDTVATIAKKYKADTSDISSYNDLSSGEKLIVGSTIIVPDGEIQFTQAQLAKSSGKNGKGGNSNDSQYKNAMGKIGGTSKQSAPKGYFIRPVVGTKTQGFHGPYNAIDIGAPEGTPIVAAAEGTVILAKGSGYNGGYGGLTIIQHPNGSQSLYAHQSKVTVNVGDHVAQGQKIGEVGHTGRVIGRTGNHLHLEFRNIKTPILY